MKLKEKIIESTEEIFTSMVMMDVAVVAEDVESSGKLKDTITGLIGLAGSAKGVLAIHFPFPVALKITSNFLGMDVAEINEDVEDAIGELANMLGGSIKTVLTENGRDIDLSLPSTISGSLYNFQPSKDVNKTIVGFETNTGRFQVELQLEK